MAAVYKGSLKLDKVSGLRADKVRTQPVKFKKDTSLPRPARSMKANENTGRNGEKL